jgi:SAM-dependent methyltransferase
VRRASDRYIATSVTAWEFGRGKLRGDPLYRSVLADGVLPPGGTLVDVGCGQGLMLALLIEAADASRAPTFDALIGIETRPRIAAIARDALAGRAAIVEGDARAHMPRAFTAALFFDVLHMMPAADQDALLEAAARALEPGGAILIRETDATAGWRFNAVRLGNRLKAIAGANWRQTFHFRTAVEWRSAANRLGFEVEQIGTSEGTPFANVLFVLRRRA